MRGEAGGVAVPGRRGDGVERARACVSPWLLGAVRCQTEEERTTPISEAGEGFDLPARWGSFDPPLVSASRSAYLPRVIRVDAGMHSDVARLTACRPSGTKSFSGRPSCPSKKGGMNVTGIQVPCLRLEFKKMTLYHVKEMTLYCYFFL